MPALSRRTLIALVAVVAGLAVIILALVGGSGSAENGTRRASSDQPLKPIKPVAPLDPDDKDAGKPKKADDSTDLFARSFGASGRRKVTVSVSANGYTHIGVYYRDRKKPRGLTATTYTETRTVKGRFPLAAVTLQIPGSGPGIASSATCTITIDGTEVSQETTSKPWVVKQCFG